MSVTAYAASRHLNFDFNGTVYVAPTIWYVGFRSTGIELSLLNYSRIAIDADALNFPVIGDTENIIENALQFVTPQAIGGDWNLADEAGLWDAPTGGNLWYYNSLDEPFIVEEGRFRTFDPGDLRIKMY